MRDREIGAGRWLLTAAAALGLLQAPAQSGTGAAPARAASAQAQATAQATYGFDIPARPLPQAIADFSAVTGLQVLYTETSTFERTAPVLRGTYTATQALERLLAGSGLIARFTSPAAVTIERSRDGSGVTTLSPVTAEARTESAYGPVDGYIAKRSATATKTDTPLIEVPRSISVVTADQIEAQGTTGVGGVTEVLRYTPGIVAAPRGLTPDRSHIILRGFNYDDSIYRDGMKGHGRDFLSFAVTTIDTYGVERVEVLRGPASILYGAGRPGGLVNLVTKRPTEETFAEVEVDAGSYDQHGGKFDLGGAANDDKTLLLRMTGLVRDGDTQVDFVDTGRVYLAPALTWRATSDTTLTLLGQYQWDDSYATNFVPASGTVLKNPNGKILNTRYFGEPNFDESETDYFSIGYILDHKFSDAFQIDHKARYENFQYDQKALFANSGFRADNRTMNRLSFIDDSDGYLVTTDTNGQFKFDLGPTANTALVGVDYKFAQHDRAFTGGAGPTLDAFNPVYGTPIVDVTSAFRSNTSEDLSQVGVYFQNQSKILDRLVVTLGGRQDWAGSESKNNTANTTADKRDNAFTGQAGLAYLFDSGFVPYASYAESFEPQSGTDAAGAAFVPTTGTQYEIGVKYQPPGHNSLVTVSGFELTQQNVLTADPNNTRFNIQTGEVRVRGVELEGKANVWGGLNLLAAYTFLDAEVTKSNGVDRGKVPVQVPAHSASLWADYTFPLGDLRGFGFGGGVRYVGESYGNNTNTFEVPSFTLFDAAIHYDVEDGFLKGLRLAVNASNLLDESYIASCNGVNSCFFGEARVVRGSVKYRW